ncbi:hypothetical protein [Methylobacterium brachythecii]|uniref:Uncharacterized protein n=1 Tax=Methylobacterium brachythecii TaxID=1176177 RepID=A0A7W6AM29_9HYPH|nr:hypothetical protein [Methylobacterium brachythecii]MBB3905111.1 hypothetical protein [Methylobacterium brachythecii]GLS44380.1 hypothetical protein GCM10007884_23680 [Methylobacterium brachythecii]
MSTVARLGQDPAASAYGDYLREKRNGMCPIQREHEKVRALLDAVKAGGERVIPERRL